jgi:hypothetical protein
MMVATMKPPPLYLSSPASVPQALPASAPQALPSSLFSSLSPPLPASPASLPFWLRQSLH